MIPEKASALASFTRNGKRVVFEQDVKVTLDLTTQVLAFDVPEDKEIRDDRDEGGVEEAKIYPTISALSRWNDFASTAVWVQKAKQFDDGLYAAVELLAQNGAESFIGKQKILTNVLDHLENSSRGKTQRDAESRESMGLIAAALILSGRAPNLSTPIYTAADEIRREFLDNEMRSKPIGFYTWTPELEGIFQQDRLLQTNLMPEQADYSPAVLKEAGQKIQLLSAAVTDSPASEPYRRYINLIQKLTNPFPPEYRDFTRIGDIHSNRKYCFFPPSRSHEGELIKTLFGTERPIPEGFSLVDTLIDAIADERISLSPTAESGWYDYQVHALEPLVIPDRMPEAEHTFLSGRYKQELTDLFKAAIALTRETHVKQIEIPLCGAMPPPIVVDIYPEISLEPTAEYFLRRAKSYTFIKKVLEDMFTAEVLKHQRRITPLGESDRPLWEELADMESLFYGAYGIISHQLGMVPQEIAGRNPQEDMNRAAKWITSFHKDPDIGADSRMMVPLFYDIERGQVKVWVFLGYTSKPLEISFHREPKARVTNLAGKRTRAELKYHRIRQTMITPISAELYVNRLLNRREMQRLCQQCRTRSRILEALKAQR